MVASASIRGSPSRTQDQQAPLGPGMFNGRAHERIDQLFLLDLTRYCLRYADDRRQVKLLDGGENGARVG